MSDVSESGQSEAFSYRSLGFIANPFAFDDESEEAVGVQLEIAAAANRLLSALDAAAGEDSPRPILVSKSTQLPAYYPLRATARVEYVLVNDEALGILHAQVPFFLMRRGRVRSTLQVIGERLAFRSFEETLEKYVERVLASPDEELASYQLLGPDSLQAFADEFGAAPSDTIEKYFGSTAVERRPELAQVADTRMSDLEPDVDESDEPLEVDATVGLAPGTGVTLEESLEGEPDVEGPIVDYIVEYTRVHLSPVIARGIRMYRERGLAAMSIEFRVTKAPRKTLAALARLASVRFRKTAILYDGFEGWDTVPQELRSSIATSLADIRWLLGGDAVIVALLERGRVPELEEQFGAGTHVDWDFEHVEKLFEEPDRLSAEVVDSWLASAAAPGAAPLTMSDSVLAALAESADGSLRRFALAASRAVDDAASRGVRVLDEEAAQAGQEALRRVDADA